MIPKIIFRTSWLYDEALKRKRGSKMPTDAARDRHLTAIKKEWEKWGIKILREISAVTKLIWHEKEIVAYMTSGVVPYSDPLTLNTRSDIHTLAHECIHRILSEPENWKRIERNWRTVSKRYKNEPKLTRNHIPIHAIHANIIKKLFGEKALKAEVTKVKHPAYIRAWEIVKKENSATIVRTLTKGLR